MAGTGLRGKGARGITVMGNAGTGVAAFGPNYRGPYGGAVDDTVEADQTMEAPHSGRMLLARQIMNSNSGIEVTIALRVNGVTQPGASVVPDGENGTFDNTLVAEFQKGDDINIILSAAGAGSGGWHYMIEYEWDDD